MGGVNQAAVERANTAMALCGEQKFAEAIALFPDEPEEPVLRPTAELVALAEAQAGLDRVDEANWNYAQAVSQLPDNVNIALRYSWFLVKQGRYDDAAEVLAPHQDLLDGRVTNTLYEIFDKLGRFEDARRMRERIFQEEEFPTDPASTATLCQLLSELNASKLLHTDPYLWLLERISTAATNGQLTAPRAILFAYEGYVRRHDAANAVKLAGHAIESGNWVGGLLDRAEGQIPDDQIAQILRQAQTTLKQRSNASADDWLAIASAHHERYAKGIDSIQAEADFHAAMLEAKSSITSLDERSNYLALCKAAGITPAAIVLPDETSVDGPDASVVWTSLADDPHATWNGVQSDQAIVIFGQLALERWPIIDVIATALAERGIMAVQVRDPQRQIFANGFGLNFPHRQKSSDALRQSIADKGVSQVATIGLSAGGYGAQLYGMTLDAAGALCFSPPSRLPDLNDAMEPRGRALMNRVHRIGPPEFPDLLPLLEQNPRFIVHAHYPSAAELDRIQAERLSGLRNVKLKPVNTSTHMIWDHWTIADWCDVIDQFFSDLKWERGDA